MNKDDTIATKGWNKVRDISGLKAKLHKKETVKGLLRFWSDVSVIAGPEIDDKLLSEFLDDDGVDIVVAKFIKGLTRNGLRPLTDPRFNSTIARIKSWDNNEDQTLMPETMPLDDFKKCLASNMVFIQSALSGNLIIPEWKKFHDMIEELFESCRHLTEGKVTTLTPQLAKEENMDKYGLSICTVDGQRLSLGDYKTTTSANNNFPLMDLTRVILYALACTEKSVEYVHKYIGKEPSGSEGEALALKNGKPHNPLIMTGGLAVSSLIKPTLCFSERFEYFQNKVQSFVGQTAQQTEYVGFNNPLALSLKDHSNRLYAIGHFLRENKCFNKENPVNLDDVMELFLHYCSIDTNCDSAAVMAATLAAGGLCPMTGEKVVYPEAVRNCLSMMNCCGVNDYSGEFMFEVGLPAKSNKAGALIVVIPNVLGMCIWSPRLDRSMNSVRGIKFCRKFTEKFVFHQFDPCGRGSQKVDPRRRDFTESKDQQSLTILFSAFNGKMTTLYRYLKEGVNFGWPDYDGRTALHLAVCGAQYDVCRFLIEKCQVDCSPVDRWDATPLDDAIKYGNQQIITYLKKKGALRGNAIVQAEQ
ncbi:glutaminase kidney isoform, mitochondrial-like isoform X1 [Bolinopsis microptera]|uniref:glutaminase kidney isoform, mitochondrial-like isoform X1 n=1 Tax=Bolinopsis microptera TaxID=2820187 RepID=UPI003078C32B